MEEKSGYEKVGFLGAAVSGNCAGCRLFDLRRAGKGVAGRLRREMWIRLSSMGLDPVVPPFEKPSQSMEIR